MDRVIWAAAVLAILAAALCVGRTRRRMRKTFARIENMLERAAEGRFSESVFDESRLSALETKFAHYLAASEASALSGEAERDRIKALISDISHQTKTPIANLLLYTEFLEEGELSEQQRGNVKVIHGQAENLRFLIDSLVKLSRLETGILVLSPKEQALEPLLRALCEKYRPGAEEKGLSLRLEETHVTAAFDFKWTEEALGNIVENAVKYTREGSIVLKACAYEMFVRIDVTDTGIGMEPEELSRIFQRFYRSEAVREKEGVGIGLYLAREIVSGENGYIKVRSAPSEGSTFSVFLPRALPAPKTQRSREILTKV